MTYVLTHDDVLAARQRIAGRVRETPIFTSRALDARADRQLYFKAEHLQRVGAFKFRGACNAVLRLSPEQARRGVATHSSGNHAAALALAAQRRGVPCWIVMPDNAPPNKRAAVAGYGGQILLCAPTLAARQAAAAAVVAETGATFVHPSEDPDVIAGQGTAALELLEQVPDLDAILAPVGGGGLVSGCAIAAQGRVQIYGAEPTGADDAARSKAAGVCLPQLHPQTVADGLRTSLGPNTWPVVRDRVSDVLTVDDDATIAAMRLVFERMKQVIEPSAAVPVAVALSDTFRRLPGLRRVGVILSGGNVDLDALPWSPR